MSVTYQRGDIVLRCDDCPAALATGTSNESAARNLARRAAWETSHHGERHLCNACAVARLFPQQQRRSAAS